MFGYGGDPNIQYVEIKMVAAGQNITAHAILGYFNADGSYGGDILEVPGNVPTGLANGRYVMASTGFAAAAGITPEFTFPPVALPSTGMLCFGGGGLVPLNPPSWSRTNMANWIDCVPYGGYTATPNKYGSCPAAPNCFTPFGLGDGTMSLTRQTTTNNPPADWALVCPPTPQVNTGGVGFNHDNHIDLPASRAFDDLTHPNSDLTGDGCGDTDDDNDNISDADEVTFPVPGCATSSATLNPLKGDSDGDRFLDGAECSLGFDPASPASKPAFNACAAAGDPDGDKIQSRLEVCHYNSNPNSNDTDGDMAAAGARDGCEITSLNTDRIVNSGDQGALASTVGLNELDAGYLAAFDITKDGIINSGDQGQMAALIASGLCP
jgi:hypothetical protein